jgi:2-oxoglutarate dehydrogenase E2 component (dihydrolipoamide succinyltransferase)
MEQIAAIWSAPVAESTKASRSEQRLAMTPLRRKLSQRLVAVKNETAMLTTFNEVDMSQVMELRNRYQKAFTEKHGLKLGFNAFFAKAVSLALAQHPSVNSMIDGEDIITPDYHDIGIAVSSPKGLMVPVIRNVETMSLARIEQAIKELADKARDKRLTVQEMSGGTFTITNGGVFGSMMSTPIINPPQSAILGLHAIKDRPVAINGKVEIRPMMYIALSYDHRIIDGKDSVGFLVKVKEMVENPTRLLFNGKDADEQLLGL